ncbi:sex peptide receptor [Caerostris extrusa]|uniref:Sex peptide receptor n=1 Tax=Caerostris extrusa TaxID=172846 RepID=A0AAV4YEX0_CAEEX|nr:sex peptide receptor [Caerostris extrusa]
MEAPTTMADFDFTTTYPDDDFVGQNYTGNYSDYAEGWLLNAEDINILMNVTRDVPLKYAMPLFGYMMPFLLFITIIANTLIVIVLAQKHMRTPH